MYVGHDDASSAYLIYFPSTNGTRVVGTPNFIEDVDAYASRLIDSTSVPALPVDPTELFYDKPTPFHDTVNPKTTFDVVGLGAWYSQEDLELISMVQLQPAATSDNQPEPDCALFWTALTRYRCPIRAPCCLLALRRCARQSQHGDTMGIWEVSTLSFPPTLLQC